MKKKKFKKIENKMLQVGLELNKLESLSRILVHCLDSKENLKNWDTENLSFVLLEKLTTTKQKFNDIEIIMKI